MEEFLKTWLDIFYAGWETRASEKQKGKGNEAYQAYQQIRKLIKEKPKVTREFVKKYLSELDDCCNYSFLEDDLDPIRILIEMLKEAGVEVKE